MLECWSGFAYFNIHGVESCTIQQNKSINMSYNQSHRPQHSVINCQVVEGMDTVQTLSALPAVKDNSSSGYVKCA